MIYNYCLFNNESTWALSEVKSRHFTELNNLIKLGNRLLVRDTWLVRSQYPIHISMHFFILNLLFSHSLKSQETISPEVFPQVNASLFTQVIFGPHNRTLPLPKKVVSQPPQRGKVLVRWLLHQPHVPGDSDLRMCGNNVKLGSWKAEGSIVMTRRGLEPIWEAELELEPSDFPLK